MGQENILSKKIICVLVVLIVVSGLLYFYANKKNVSTSLPQPRQLTDEEKYNLLAELNKKSSTTLSINTDQKLNLLRSLAKGSATTTSESDKLKLLQELQNKK